MCRLSLSMLLLLGCGLSACVTPPTSVHQPLSARPVPQALPQNSGGSIYQTVATRPLFEDRRARMVGDTLVINLVESTTASKSSSASASKDSSIAAGITGITKLPGKFLSGLDVGASNANAFEGKGAAGAKNAFTGTITVTVIEVYPNGNLLVSGEKQIAINQGDEFIRFSGVINPANVTTSNSVQSTQVADARLEYKATGYIDEMQTMGWLQRFFTTILPL